MFVTRETSQLERSLLNSIMSENAPDISVTPLTVHKERSAVKDVMSQEHCWIVTPPPHTQQAGGSANAFLGSSEQNPGKGGQGFGETMSIHCPRFVPHIVS